MIVVTIGAAFGVLSGKGAFLGMFSAAIMCTITSVIGGSRYGITTPTGPMTAAVAVIIAMNQSWITEIASGANALSLLNSILILAGLILWLLSLLKVHKLVTKVPKLVISGFVNGIAVLILMSQFNALSLGSDWVLMIITCLLCLSFSRYCDHFDHLAWRILASSFGAIIIMSIISWLLQLPVTYLNISGNLSDLALMLPEKEIFEWRILRHSIPLAVELALIALLDTLLTAIIMDKKSGKKTQHRRELFAQGASFLGISLFGGLPGAQSTVPSMLMYEEKNHHPWSKLILSGFCLALCLALSGFLQFVPSAVFGGVIVKIAIDVADLTAFRSVLSSSHSKKYVQLFLILAVLFSTVLISLNVAVIGCTLFFVFWNRIMPKKLHIPDLGENQQEGLIDEI